ncbi:hypothetical protein FRC17_004879 [Serendipita sp. 399]|nr:hypothetical protein FRC17_004879 [Serendipita sp. 399]
MVQRDHLDGLGGKGGKSPPMYSSMSVSDGRVHVTNSPQRHSPHQSIPSIASLSPLAGTGPPLTDANLAALETLHRTRQLPTPAPTVFSRLNSSRSSESTTSYSAPTTTVEPTQFSPSIIAEGHLPLLNQVLQLGKRWIDWKYERDPAAPITTPIWNATGTMSGFPACKGRGNTKKLAKSEAARSLVEKLQLRLGRKPSTTANLAKELEKWWAAQKFDQPIYEEPEDVSPAFDDLNLNSDSRSSVPSVSFSLLRIIVKNGD